MAIMYPKNIELVKHTSSEKKVYIELEKQLPNTFSVYFSVAWVDSQNGGLKESECDFLIFNDSLGFLTCEVKGGSSYYKIGDTFYVDNRKLNRSPMEQAEESSRYFTSLYSSTYNDNFRGIYGSISIFPYYRVDDPVLLDHRDKDIVLDINDIDNLCSKINKVFSYYRKKRRSLKLTDSQKNNFKKMIEKDIATRAVAGSIIVEKEYELNMINRVQDNFIYFLNNYNRTFISGGAGTGKSWIATKFAKKASKNNKSVLLTTDNEQLINMFKKILIDYPKVDIISFKNLLIKDGVDDFLISSDLINAYNNLNYDKYDTIIVDEAQDFDEYQACVITMHLKSEDSEFRVFYDLTQNIFNKNFRDGFDIKYPAFQLVENLRNTESIYKWATDNTELGKDVITNQIIGPEPITYQLNNFFDAFKYTENLITSLVNVEKVKIPSIVILLDDDNYLNMKDKYIGNWKCKDFMFADEDDIKISKVENYKGLESDIVFYVHNFNTDDVYNYVAYTRARYYLYDIRIR